MSNSLFLDPFQDPFAAPGPGAGGVEESPEVPARAADTVPGTVVDSGPAADRADRSSVSVGVPLDLVDAASAFLEDTHLWWPRDLKATDREGHVYFGEGQVLEEGTEGEVHPWGTVLGASDTTLELDWRGRAPAVPGAATVSSEGARVFLTWGAVASGGAELSVRGREPERWLGEWSAILAAFARFTGGRVLEDADGAGAAEHTPGDGETDPLDGGETRS
ncbi:hypothetical protein [Microbacterium sp. A93]|uniref:hypothetical protein n=1 Tax=Microbacterium sp. A93 TaxID=3450716 RepID=UPI003F427A68